MIRLHVPGMALAAGATVALDGDRHHYLSRVLRVRDGAPIELFAGDGRVHVGAVAAVDRRAVTVRLDSERPGLALSPLRVIVLQSLLRGSRLELVVQKATELGVAELRLVECARCVARRPGTERLRRLRTIAEEAAEQCGRAEVPPLLAPLPLVEAFRALPAEGRRLVLWEDARHVPLAGALGTGLEGEPLTLLCGPEGGLDAGEVDAAREAGFRVVGLGPRVLRAETAPIAALAVLQYARGDLGGPPSEESS